MKGRRIQGDTQTAQIDKSISYACLVVNLLCIYLVQLAKAIYAMCVSEICHGLNYICTDNFHFNKIKMKILFNTFPLTSIDRKCVVFSHKVKQ